MSPNVNTDLDPQITRSYMTYFLSNYLKKQRGRRKSKWTNLNVLMLAIIFK